MLVNWLQQRKQSHSFNKMVSDVVVHVSLCCDHVHCIYYNVLVESVMTLPDQRRYDRKTHDRPSFRNCCKGGGGGGGGEMSVLEKMWGRSHVSVGVRNFCFLDSLRWHMKIAIESPAELTDSHVEEVIDIWRKSRRITV